ncbi:uncharacterized protein LOC144434008 [Glandiceps talaboti]
MSDKQDLQKAEEGDAILHGQRDQNVYVSPPTYQQPPPPPPYMYGQTIQTTAGLPVTVQPNNGQAPPDHLALAIFATVCCFWPTGIFAILRASDARVAAARNDLTTAWDHANKAKKMSCVSIGIGIALILLIMLFMFVEYMILLPLLMSDFNDMSTTAATDLEYATMM